MQSMAWREILHLFSASLTSNAQISKAQKLDNKFFLANFMKGVTSFPVLTCTPTAPKTVSN